MLWRFWKHIAIKFNYTESKYIFGLWDLLFVLTPKLAITNYFLRYCYIPPNKVLDSASLLRRMGVSHNTYTFDSPPTSQESNVSNSEHMEGQSPVSPEPNDEEKNSSEFPDTDAVSCFDENETYEIDQRDVSVEFDDNNNEDMTLENLERVQVNLSLWKGINICPECGDRIASQNISRHIKEVHLQKRYPCETCNKSFLRKCYLLKHKCGNMR